MVWSRLARPAGIAAVAALTLATIATSSPDPAFAEGLGGRGTSEFRGVNWADPRDNYASDAVVPSGLSTEDDYATTYAVATGILSEFQAELDANTVRLPINPASVGTDWWSSYRGAIDAAIDLRMKVIISYWESDDAKDGRIDDPEAFDAMWDTVAHEYGRQRLVYLEPMNEPFGYTLEQWVDLTSDWLADHRRDIPRSRVVISGTGYNDNVTGVGAAPELRGTLLSLHFYGFWASDTTEAAWLANLAPRIGDYAHRTIIDEAGSPMTIGLNYGNHEGDTSTAYLGALTQTARENAMGIVYWPGLRTGDSYSMTTQVAPGDLVVNSESGLAQLQWGWGLLDEEPVNDLPPAPPGEPVQGVASGRCLDVPGWSTTPGTALDLWDCNGGGNQSWDVTEGGGITVYADMCLTASGGGAAVIEDCSGSPAQQWSVTADGEIASASDRTLCLAAVGTGNGSAVVVATCDGSDSQRWLIG